MSFFKSRNILIVLIYNRLCFSSILPSYANTLENQINRSQGELSAIEKDLQSRETAEEYQSEEKNSRRTVQLENSLAVLRQEINQLEKDIENTEKRSRNYRTSWSSSKKIELKDELLKAPARNLRTGRKRVS